MAHPYDDWSALSLHDLDAQMYTDDLPILRSSFLRRRRRRAVSPHEREVGFAKRSSRRASRRERLLLFVDVRQSSRGDVGESRPLFALGGRELWRRHYLGRNVDLAVLETKQKGHSLDTSTEKA